MSDNIKLVIEIPKKEYEAFKELIAINIGGRCSGKGIIQTCLNAVKNGIPLNSVKAEIEASMYCDKDTRLVKNANASGLEKAIKILDNIGKAESEDI